MAGIKSPNLLQLLLLASVFCCTVSGLTDCTLPWMGRITSEQDEAEYGFIGEVKYVYKNTCPTPFTGDLDKKYCCYNLHGEVECCGEQGFLVMISIILILMSVVTLTMCCFICRRCCSCLCSCFNVCKRRQNGRVLAQHPMNYVFVEAVPTTLASHQSYNTPALNGSAPLISNEYLPSRY